MRLLAKNSRPVENERSVVKDLVITSGTRRVIPFQDLEREYLATQADLEPALLKVLASGRYILGKETEEFEEQWSKYCGAAAAVLVGSGTDALTIALSASGLIKPGSGDEVITAALGSLYTPLAILRAGAKPVFADVDAETMLLTPATIEQVLTPRTRAIIPVHLYGLPCDMAGIMELARRHGLAVIEDACQAHGARVCADGWRRAGTIGLAGAFSFYPTKNLACLGDAGAIVSSDMKLIERARILRNGGQQERDLMLLEGFNSRCDEIQAAILNRKLPCLDGWSELRRNLASRYHQRLKLSDLCFQVVPPGREPVYHLFVIRHPRRNQLQAYLRQRGIETMIHYRVVLHRQPAFENSRQADCPEAERAVSQILSLPLYRTLSESAFEKVVNAVNEFGD
jgi:dTDP-4-amino-4,6-dideoxygalactose transaminase